ncbi:MAG: hypothetical protein HN509_09570 [Halobacteriovoraceae bacterium]|jgi:tetratricopeptide (TPR) repeat protein|nr:hypothetical protein [Halobacteriovoraceae bacterium]MBT5094888.1 hypothetical protein [Halobacteriovoraceae bacterium]
MRQGKAFLILIFCCLTLQAAFAMGPLARAFKSFNTGDYVATIKLLKNFNGSKKSEKAVKWYLSAISQARLQKFDQAVDSFARANRYKQEARDFFYEYGQALYAANSLEEARRNFLKSVGKKFKKATSLYYVAHISQILEQHKTAKRYYRQILKEEKRDKNVLQIASFQLAEVLLSMAETTKKPAAKVKKYVLPQMRKAIVIQPEHRLVVEIKNRILEVQRQYGLDPNQMINGKTLPERRWNLSFKEVISYDTNITQSTDLITAQATQKDSYIYTSSLRGKYTLNPNNRFIANPEVQLLHVKHSDQDNATVFENDAYQIIPALNNSLEHSAFGKPASFLFGLEYNYTARDRGQKHEIIKYATSITQYIGEKFRYFSGGNTGVKFKLKTYRAFQKTQDNNTFSMVLDQVISLKSGNLLLFFISADFINNIGLSRESTNSFLFRVDYIIPEFLKGYMLNIAHGFTLIDTRQQQATRGYERQFNPSLKLTKNISRKFSVAYGHDYTRVTSKDKTGHEYSKNVTSLELKYKF